MTLSASVTRSAARLAARVATLAGALLMAASPLHAAQGVLIVQTTTIDGVPRTSQIQIEPTRMRTEVSGQDGSVQVLLFDGTRQVMYLISPAAKSYREMTKADMDAAGAQLQGALAQMQKAMENMPPAQRAQMEALMKSRGVPDTGAATKPEYRRNGSSTVGRWACDVYDSYVAGQKTGEICTTPVGTLGLAGADFDVSRQLAAFLRGLLPQAADQVFQVGRVEEQGFSGVPVRTISTVAGRRVVTEMAEVKRQTFSDADFQVPEGFTRQQLPIGARGRGRGAQP